MPIYRDREWEAADNAPIGDAPRTRMQEQRHIDDLFLRGKIDRDEWSTRYDELSSPYAWTAKGRIQKK